VLCEYLVCNESSAVIEAAMRDDALAFAEQVRKDAVVVNR
jgi:hypothetical protein